MSIMTESVFIYNLYIYIYIHNFFRCMYANVISLYPYLSLVIRDFPCLTIPTELASHPTVPSNDSCSSLRCKKRLCGHDGCWFFLSWSLVTTSRRHYDYDVMMFNLKMDLMESLSA